MPSSLNLVFCGTPRFAAATLDSLIAAAFPVLLVVTQPDRPKGRGMELVSSPVKERALELGLPIAQPERIKNNEELRARLTALKPDAIIIVGYGRIVPQWMLDLPPLGNINLHASLLPKYRGAAPIQWAIAHGETITGVTTMRIDAGLDTGDILLQREVAVSAEDTALTLGSRLATVGAELMVETLRGLQGGTIQPHPQDAAHSSLAPILKKEDGRIDFSKIATEILNRLRGFQPWPGAYSTFRGKNLQVRNARALNLDLASGELKVEGEHLFAGCAGATAIEILEIQLEGKKPSLAADFIRGYRPMPREKLGS
jgi:methionyl-tRNA formyltransferase